jgi:hypothetical protein
MTTIIRAYRERPITRPGQVEHVLVGHGIGPYPAHAHIYSKLPKKLRKEWAKEAMPTNFVMTAEQMKAVCGDGVGRMCRDVTEWPAEYDSFVSVEQYDDGSQIELEIALADGAKAQQLILELRMCGFVGGIVTDWESS